MNGLERRLVEKVISAAHAVGVPIPPAIHDLCLVASGAARGWADANPSAILTCCIAAAVYGNEACTCWTPIFDTEQLAPVPDDIECQPAMCSDCAYRPGSPERSSAAEEEVLLDLPAEGSRFFCHQGIRRPLKYVHPDGHEWPGIDADYQPAIDPRTPGVPYRADGRPALLCAGWDAHHRKLEGAS